MVNSSDLFRFEKSSDLPSARCRSLVFAIDQAIFCISGLVDTMNDNNNKKLRISTVKKQLPFKFACFYSISKDILKWSEAVPQWAKVSETPELTKFHALSFNGKVFSTVLLDTILIL
jgi:hypothetical protein